MSFLSDAKAKLEAVEQHIVELVREFEPQVQAELKQDLAAAQAEVARIKAEAIQELETAEEQVKADLDEGKAALANALANAAPEVKDAVSKEFDALVQKLLSHLV